jgi:hypothetical protein
MYIGIRIGVDFRLCIRGDGVNTGYAFGTSSLSSHSISLGARLTSGSFIFARTLDEE